MLRQLTDMRQKLTFLTLFFGLMGVLPITCIAAAGNKIEKTCAEILLEASSAANTHVEIEKGPKEIDSFVERIEREGVAFLGSLHVIPEDFGHAPKTRIASKDLGQTEIVDYRAYAPITTGESWNGYSNIYIDKIFVEQIRPALKGYRYIHSASESATEHFATFQSSDGTQFSISHTLFPKTEQFLNSIEYGRAVQYLLDRTSTWVRQKITSEGGFDHENLQTSPRIYNSVWKQEGAGPAPVAFERFPIQFVSHSNNYRYVTRSTYESNDLFTEVIDTRIGRDSQDLARRSNVLYPSLEKKENYQISDGRLKQKQYLDEIMSFIFPLYAKRRGWTEEFIRKLYKKTFETADNTKYIVVREKTSDGKPGKILAAMGLTRAPYGKIKFFNKTTNKWEEDTGPFGSVHDYFQEGKVNLADDPSKWQDPVYILAMEQYLGVHLPRPSHIEYIQRPTQDKNLFPRSPIADYSKPIFGYTGQIYEPVRFGVAKKGDLRGQAYSAVIIEIFKAIFSSERSDFFNLNGQYLYTYNDPAGVSIYKAMGFKPVSSFGPVTIDNENWTVLGLSPTDVIAKAKDPAFLASKASEEFAKQLLENLAKLMEKSVVNSEK